MDSSTFLLTYFRGSCILFIIVKGKPILKFIVYKLTSPSGKSYIGLTKQTLSKRWKQHTYAWRRWEESGKPYTSHCPKLYNAFSKHDPTTWIKEVLRETDSETECCLAEIKFISEYNTIDDGYNILKGGQHGHHGHTMSDETKLKMSNGRKKFYATEEGQKWRKHLSKNSPILQYNGWAGQTHTEETKEKMRGPRPQTSIALKGKIRAQEHCDAISKAKLGKPAPEKTKAALRAANVGRAKSQAHKDAISTKIAKTYEITRPDGSVITITNLSKFAVAEGLSNPGNLSSVATGKLKHYKGYKAKLI